LKELQNEAEFVGVALGQAIAILKTEKDNNKKIKVLKDLIISAILEKSSFKNKKTVSAQTFKKLDRKTQ
jgi:L-cysteine desulfidase